MIEVGCGISEITPPVGTPLSGFIFRENRPSTGVDDPLLVRVLVLHSMGQLYWLIDYELLGIGSIVQDHIYAELSAGLGADFSPERCVIVAVHTHSGPTTMHLRGEALLDPSYITFMCHSTLVAARAALQNLQPAQLFQAKIEIPGLTYNRRALLDDGRVSMALHPDEPVLQRGPVDSLLTLLVWKNASEQNLAAAVHFACHGVAVCTQNIGSDIPGAISRHFERILNAPCLFLQGAAGDTNPLVVSTVRSEMLAWVDQFEDAVYGLTSQLRPVAYEPFVAAAETIPLAYKSFPTPEQVRKRIGQFEHIAKGDVASPGVAGAMRLLGDLMNVPPGETPDAHKAAFCAQALLSSERDILTAIEGRTDSNACPLQLTVWRMGSLALAFVGAELFTLTGQEIRQLGNGLDVLPVTYAAPVVGYIPDAAAMALGGYEVDFAWHFYGSPAPFVPQSTRDVVMAIRRLLAVAHQRP